MQRKGTEMLDELKEWLDKEPFVLFRVVVTSGGAYDVVWPYQVAIGQTQFDCYFPRSDRKASIRLNPLVAIETLDEAKSA
jgi:hypothetical protein